MKEGVLIKVPGAVGIGVGKCALGRGGAQALMTGVCRR